MKILLAALTLIAALPSAALAQDGKVLAVIETIDSFLNALNTQDAGAMRALMTEDGTISLIDVNEVDPVFRARDYAEFLELLGTSESSFHENYWDPQVLISGPVAVVVAPYSFDIAGERSHCGTDVFTLFDFGSEWRIASVQYSVDADACPAGR